uniref:Cystathionine gamma-synthase n=1 Tax=Aureoumbra lagunensis TaxID=44058 RepID=A0A7S3JWH9_9STRA
MMSIAFVKRGAIPAKNYYKASFAQRKILVILWRGMTNGKKWSTATVALHADAVKEETRERYTHDYDVSPPIGMTTTFIHEGKEAHVYSRPSTPTRCRTEAVLAALESQGGIQAEATLFSSGLAAAHAAISVLMQQNKAKRRLLLSRPLYHGIREVAASLQAMNPNIQIDELGKPEDLEPGDIAWLETPANPTGELKDIKSYAQYAKNRKCNIVVDATLGPPPLQYPLSIGASLVIHSATKALAGHSDALAGVVLNNSDDEMLTQMLRQHRNAVGGAPGSLETWLLLRSLRTLQLRIERQNQSAFKLAQFLRTHPAIAKVHRECHTQLAHSQMPNGVGGVFAIEVHSEEVAKALPAQLYLFKDATSLGGVESLAEWRRRYDDTVSPYLIRLSIGLEDPDDLIADFEQALRHRK